MLLAPQNFRDSEYIVPRAIWEQNGGVVRTVSTTEESIGKFGYSVTNDFLLPEPDSDDFDGIFLVGGGGSLAFQSDSDAQNLVEEFYQAGKPVGAICAAPRNLLTWGILNGRKCTGSDWDGQFDSLCEKYGARFVNEPVVVDDSLLTANGPEAAELAAVEFLELLG